MSAAIEKVEEPEIIDDAGIGGRSRPQLRLITAPGSATIWSDLLAALDSVGQPRNWHAEGAIEGNPIILFSGPEKSHKSWTAMQLAVATVTGGAWLERFAIRRPGRVVYLDGEYGSFEFARRAARISRGAGHDPREVLAQVRHYYSSDLVLAPNDAALKRVLAEAEAEPPALIVVDPFRNHLDGSENDAEVVLGAFKCLGMLRDAGNCPVLVIHHLNKSGGFTGSRAITTRADLIIEGSDGDAPIYSVRGRTIRPTIDPIAEQFTISIEHTHDDDDSKAATRMFHAPALVASKAKADTKGLSNLGAKIVEFLAKQDEPRSANYIAKAVGRNNADVSTELERLQASGRVEMVPDCGPYKGRMYDGWRLTSQRPSAAGWSSSENLKYEGVSTEAQASQTKGPDERRPDVWTDESPTSGGDASQRSGKDAAKVHTSAPDEHQT